MDEPQLQQRTLSPPSPSQTLPLFSNGKSSTSPTWSGDLGDFAETGLEFYPSVFDNSFPYPGILSNERTFSCSSPTSNTPFPETTFNAQPILKGGGVDGAIQQENENYGLLTTTQFHMTPNDMHGQEFPGMIKCVGSPISSSNGQNGGRGLFLPTNFPPLSNNLNDSGVSLANVWLSGQKWGSPPKTANSTSNSQFDFSFTVSESSSSNGGGERRSSNGSSSTSSASANSSPTRYAPGSLASFNNQWNSSDVASLLEEETEGSCSSSGIPNGLGNSIWSPSQGSNMSGSNGSPSFPSPISINKSLEADLAEMNKRQLLNLVDLLGKQLGESKKSGDTGVADQLQALINQVQRHIINKFVYKNIELDDDYDRDYVNGNNGYGNNSAFYPIPLDHSPGRKIGGHQDNCESHDPQHTWTGDLPPRYYKHPVTFSRKVFLGGLPFDVTEVDLIEAFKPFGISKIEWPGKEVVTPKIKGFAYALFESEKQVKLLLQHCTIDYTKSPAGEYFYKVSTRRNRGKNVQIIPWAMHDSNFALPVQNQNTSKIDPLRMIFVGGVHGQINAEALATIFDAIFGGVVYAGVDQDPNRYPIGSARIMFANTKSFMKAVNARFVTIKTKAFTKIVQVDPYLSEATCSICRLQQAPYFCRNNDCFRYYCNSCFFKKHADPPFNNHGKPMTRNTKNGGNKTNPLGPFGQRMRYGNNGYHHGNYRNNYFDKNEKFFNHNNRWSTHNNHSNNHMHNRHQPWSNGGGRSISPPSPPINNGLFAAPPSGFGSNGNNSGGNCNKMNGLGNDPFSANQPMELGGPQQSPPFITVGRNFNNYRQHNRW